MLTIDNLALYKDDKKIFSNLSFSLSTSATLLIVGKNGVGKTSLLKIIAGISKATSGKILWGEEDIENFRDDFNGDLQFIGHKNFLKNELTVAQNLEFYAQLSGSEVLVSAAISFFKLNDYANKKVKTLSAGWQKRAMLAKLICCPATIWLLDEPSNNLDIEGKELLKKLIQTRAKEDGVVILTAHDQDFSSLGSKLNLEDYQ